MKLNNELFSHIIKNTPLISINLIVKNSKGKILLGKRINEPAKGFWFVPGGRIFKDETFYNASIRTLKEEIGINLIVGELSFCGFYEHFYENNVFNDTFTTHYIVLVHKIIIDSKLILNNQHESYRWFDKEELLNREDVHKYTKDYFKGDK